MKSWWRPTRPLTPAEEAMSGSFAEVRGTAQVASALEFAFDPDLHPHDERGRWASTAGEKDIVEKVKEQGGLTIKPFTGEVPTDGYVISQQHTSKFVPEKEFFNPAHGAAAIIAYVKANAYTKDDWLGLWHDEAHHEVTLDRVDNFVGISRDEAISIGRDRNQQSIWDVKAGEAIDTGGTGDRPN